LDESELEELFIDLKKATEVGEMKCIKISGLMGMASFTPDVNKVKLEFKYLRRLFDKYSQQTSLNCQLKILSMGMSADYKIAMEEGGNLVRIGSLLFGSRPTKVE
jgi:uncharacterized pyridoxal phosphate-containing UPF0001 family protein